jgi:hypothetical protein
MMPKDKLRQLTGKERLGMNRDSEYLGAEDISEGISPVLTISGLWNGLVTLQRGKENKDVLTFKEEKVPGMSQVRPLIVNATNRKTLKKLYKGVTAEILTGKKIQLYVDHSVRDPQDGGITDGVRIKQVIPPGEARNGKSICLDCGSEIAATEKMTAAQIVAFARKRFGADLCAGCMKKRQAQAEAESDGQNDATAPEKAKEDETIPAETEPGESDFERAMKENAK